MNKKENMITILTGITSVPILKYAFGYSCLLQAANFLTPNNTLAGDFIDNILSAVPSRLAGYLGVVYALAIVFKKVSQVWKSHNLDKLEVKVARQDFKQKELETNSKIKESN